MDHADRAEQVRGHRKVMLITLGQWVVEPDSWDESAWGGSTTATRRGYGYYKGMADENLLNSCLFWRFNPDSATWCGIEYAVVAYEGRTRAVVRIDSFIGPFWGKHGFRGHMITDPALVQNMVGREGRSRVITVLPPPSRRARPGCLPPRLSPSTDPARP